MNTVEDLLKVDVYGGDAALMQNQLIHLLNFEGQQSTVYRLEELHQRRIKEKPKILYVEPQWITPPYKRKT